MRIKNILIIGTAAFIFLISFFGFTNSVYAVYQQPATIITSCPGASGSLSWDETEWAGVGNPGCSWPSPDDYFRWLWGPGATVGGFVLGITQSTDWDGSQYWYVYFVNAGLTYEEGYFSFWADLPPDAICCDEGVLNGTITLPTSTYGACAGYSATVILGNGICGPSCDDYCKNKTYQKLERLNLGGPRNETVLSQELSDPINYLEGRCDTQNPGDEPPWYYMITASPNSASQFAKEGTTASQQKGLWNRLSAFIGLDFFKKTNQENQEKEVSVKLGSCFEYKPESIKFKKLSIENSDLKNLKAGDTVSFKATISSTGVNPVADGAVYIKVQRQKENREPHQGNYLVDDFIAVGQVNLWPNEEKEIKFSWVIPQNAVEGVYDVGLYFVGSEHFILSGITSMSNFPAGEISFDVKGASKGFWLDNDNIQVNQYKIDISTFFPTLEKGDVKISLPLKSTMAQGEANVFVDLYSADLLDENSKLLQYSQKKDISLAPATQLLEFNFPNLNPDVYVAKVTVEGNGQKSVADIRFRVAGGKGKIISAGIKNFPPQKGGENALFACFLNYTDNASGFVGKAEVQLKEKKTGKVLAEMTSPVILGSKAVSIKKNFALEKSYGDLVLESRLYNNKGQLVDRVETEYNINDFTKLPVPSVPIKTIIILSLAIISGVVLLYLAARFLRKKGVRGTKIFLILAVVVSSAFFSQAIVRGQITIWKFFPESGDYATVNFQCLESDQPCSQYWYDLWGNQGLQQGTDWFPIQTDQQMKVKFSHQVWKDSNYTSLSTEPSSPTNVSLGDYLRDQSSPEGDFLQNQGYLSGGGGGPTIAAYSPTINWLEDINQYYSDPTVAFDPVSRRCVLSDGSADDHECPPGGDQSFVGEGGTDDFNAWCNNAYNTPYADDNFGLEYTHTLWYDVGKAPAGWYYEDAACIGTQINCERTMTISVDRPDLMECTLTKNTERRGNTYETYPDDSPQSCTTNPSGTCGLKAVEIDSSCEPKGSGQVAITVKQDFDCFAYYDRAVFVKMNEVNKDFWAGFNYDCDAGAGEQCWCKGEYQKNEITDQQCAGLYYPMKMTKDLGILDPSQTVDFTYTNIDTSSLQQTYYVDVVDSQVNIENYQVGSGSLVSPVSQVDILSSDLPTNIGYNFTYSDMYPGEPWNEGTPDIAELNCGHSDTLGDIGSYQSGSCTNPGENNSGTCTVVCSYDAGISSGSYNFHLKIANNEKFAETTIPLQVQGSNTPPIVIPPPPPPPPPSGPNRPPGATFLPTECCFYPTSGGVNFNWPFYDPDVGDFQDAYQVQVDNDANFSSPVIDSCVPAPGTCASGHSSQEYVPLGSPFLWGVNYHWRVRVMDNHDAWSEWVSSLPSDFSSSAWPWPEFDYQPEGGVKQTCSETNCNWQLASYPIVSVTPGESLTLWNESQTRHSGFCSNGCTYSWDFGDGQTYAGLTPPAHNYSAGTYLLMLTATDSTDSDRYCKLRLNVSVGGALLPPRWIEIPPF